MEYNPYASKGKKKTVFVRFITKIHAILFIYTYGFWQIQSYVWKIRYLKNGIWEIPIKST